MFPDFARFCVEGLPKMSDFRYFVLMIWWQTDQKQVSCKDLFFVCLFGPKTRKLQGPVFCLFVCLFLFCCCSCCWFCCCFMFLFFVFLGFFFALFCFVRLFFRQNCQLFDQLTDPIFYIRSQWNIAIHVIVYNSLTQKRNSRKFWIYDSYVDIYILMT